MTGDTCRVLAERALGTAAAFVCDLTGRPIHGNPDVMAAVASSPRRPSSSLPNLVIYGSTGTGKTFLTHCITGEVMDAGKTCIYLTAAEFVDVAEQAEFKHQPEDFRNCFTCDLLVIDDLGTELVLNRKSTVISTNLMLDQLQTTYSDRTFSRLGGNYKFIRLVGADHRVE